MSTGEEWAGYRSLAAATLHSGFRAVVRPNPSVGRLQEWLFFFTERAETFADGLNLDLPFLLAEAWEHGILLNKGGEPYPSPPFRTFKELAGVYPAGPEGGLAGGWFYPPWGEAVKPKVRRALHEAERRAVRECEQARRESEREAVRQAERVMGRAKGQG